MLPNSLFLTHIVTQCVSENLYAKIEYIFYIYISRGNMYQIRFFMFICLSLAHLIYMLMNSVWLLARQNMKSIETPLELPDWNLSCIRKITAVKYNFLFVYIFMPTAILAEAYCFHHVLKKLACFKKISLSFYD